MGYEVVFVDVELCRERKDLLDLANMALKGFDTPMRIQVPKLDGAVIGGRKERAAGQIYLYRIDPVAMSSKRKALECAKVVDHDGIVGRARGQEFVGHM
jgi:hypothetical protein